MSHQNVEALTEALLDQAKRDRQRLIHEAEVRAQRTIAQAEGDALAQRAHITEHAEEVAADLLREARGASRLEAQATKVRKREALLDEVFSRAAEKLAEFDQQVDYGEVVIGLVLDAVRATGLARQSGAVRATGLARQSGAVRQTGLDRHTPDQPLDRAGGSRVGETKSMVILADEVARRVLDEATLQRLEAEAGIEMTLGEVLDQRAGQPRRLGVVVQSSDGHLRYDNTLQTRLTRMRGGLRASTFRVLMGESE
jgi:vacuolar-type H+-ATPase subunit E/Vma4